MIVSFFATRLSALMHSGPTFVAPGETSVAADLGPASLYGHGFQVSGSKNVTSNVCGPVRLMDKLISARPLRFQYYPEMGDVVLGRVTEILVKRWKIDLNTRHDAALQLSAVHLPDGVQRRRNADDELSMRNRYGEHYLIIFQHYQFLVSFLKPTRSLCCPNTCAM